VQLITKPFSYAALAGKLRDLLDARAGKTRILLVEDEALIQMLAVDNLEELGFEAEVAGSGAEAKSKLSLIKGEVDGAIVDIGLPDLKGDLLVKELRTMYPALPVVIASGEDEATLRERFAGQGRIAFLAKPYTLLQMRDALRAIGVLD
jgi:DNA-binding response OmpR family regulator